jgi:uncharacterized protein YdaU (DUF1376 family)
MKKRKLCNLDQERVDMFLPLFCRDFLMSTIGWSAAQRGHYLTLLMVQWDAGFLPQELDALDRISGGISEAWNLLEDKFPVGKDGLRRNMRLEEHRSTAVEIRKKRQQNGQKGGKPKGNQMGTHLVTHPGDLSQTSAKPGLEHPEPEPEPQSLSKERETERSSLAPQADAPKQRAVGYAMPAWEAFLAAWNQAAGRCRHIARYDSFNPPQTFLDRIEELGWLEDYGKGIARLERCQWFTTPVAMTWFLKQDTMQAILAGQYDPKKPQRDGDSQARPPVVSSRMWRDDACQNMTDEQYAAWRKKQSGLAHAGKTTAKGSA